MMAHPLKEAPQRAARRAQRHMPREQQDDSDAFICEVCWDNRVEGEKWKEKNLC